MGNCTTKPSENTVSQAVEEVAPIGEITYMYAELKSATRNFSNETLLWEGELSRIFQGLVEVQNHALPSKLQSECQTPCN